MQPIRRSTFLIGLIALLSAGSASSDDWNIVHQAGRDYVSFSNVAHFYQFPEYTRVSHTVSLRKERSAIRAQAGTSNLYINGVRFFTDFPILTNGTDELISAMDVSWTPDTVASTPGQPIDGAQKNLLRWMWLNMRDCN
jgi:hypothetical protein